MSVTLKYIGWASFLLADSKGNKVLTDPFLIGDETKKIPRACLQADEINCDLIVVSHPARDHFQQGPDVLRHNEHAKALGDHATMVYLQKNGINGRCELTTSGAIYEFGDFKITAYDARHISFVHFPDGSYLTGEPLVYIIEIKNGPTLFFGGDTSVNMDMKLFGEMYSIDYALLGIGGVEFPDGRCLEEMNPKSAAFACKLLGAKEAIPMHFFKEEAPKTMQKELDTIKYSCRVVNMKYGDTITLE